MDTATETRLDAAKTASRKVVHKTAEARGDLIGNEIAEKILKPKTTSDDNWWNVEKIVIPPEKRPEILNELRQVL